MESIHINSGTAASSGLAIAKTFVLKKQDFQIPLKKTDSIEHEINLFYQAIGLSKEDLKRIQNLALKKVGKEAADIFEAHLLVLEDPEMIQQTLDKIKCEQVTAAFAYRFISQNYCELFRNMKNEYMKERASDIEDVSSRVLGYLLHQPKKDLSSFHEKVILVAEDITPSDMATLDTENVCGFITSSGGKTSHAAIMARTLEIPAISGIKNAVLEIPDNTLTILNGETAEITIQPSPEELLKNQTHLRTLTEEKKELLKLKDTACITKDGFPIRLASNIGTPEQILHLKNKGVQEIGLFRTEFVFMNKNSLPTEEEQFQAYKKVLEAFSPHGVVIRTLDIGGDKELPYLKLPKEQNPFLGVRAIRLCFQEKEIFKTQLKALLRASVFGNLKIMFPMISSMEELREAKKILFEVQSKLEKETPHTKYNYETGIMIEIPSAALISDLLAKEVDFFSIGTNDLIQYTCAVDRMNESITHLYNPYHPAVLRLIKLTIENAHKNGKWVGMCGEMAGQLEFIPYFIGLGLDEFSISLSSFLKAKKLILSLNKSECVQLVNQIDPLSSSLEIESLLKSRQ